MALLTLAAQPSELATYNISLPSLPRSARVRVRIHFVYLLWTWRFGARFWSHCFDEGRELVELLTIRNCHLAIQLLQYVVMAI